MRQVQSGARLREGGALSSLRSYTANERSRETDSRRPPHGENASCVTVSVCACSGGPAGAHVPAAHSHTAANGAVCACSAGGGGRVSARSGHGAQQQWWRVAGGD